MQSLILIKCIAFGFLYFQNVKIDFMREGNGIFLLP